jgi:spermidine synthase
MQAKSPICPKKKQRELIFDRDVLTCEYHSAMLAGLSLIGDHLVEKVKAGEKINVLVLGTGAGVFSMFLRHHFSIHLDQLVTVDINPGVIKVAQEFFGFHPDEVLKSEIADAFAFVLALNPESYDIVIMDVNYEEEDVKVSPPKKFFEPEFIR